MKSKSKKSNSNFKQYFILAVIVGAIVFLFKTFTDGESAFNIDSSSSFGSPVKKGDKNLDEAGHTEDFWTSGRFKW